MSPDSSIGFEVGAARVLLTVSFHANSSYPATRLWTIRAAHAFQSGIGVSWSRTSEKGSVLPAGEREGRNRFDCRLHTLSLFGPF